MKVESMATVCGMRVLNCRLLLTWSRSGDVRSREKIIDVIAEEDRAAGRRRNGRRLQLLHKRLPRTPMNYVHVTILHIARRLGDDSINGATTSGDNQ